MSQKKDALNVTVPAIDYELLFGVLPERYVVMASDSPHFTMLTASKEYLKITGKKLSDIAGYPLFDVFPDTSPLALKTGKGELQRSFDKVLETAKPDSTGVIRYDISNKKGKLDVRYWQATHYPLKKAGKVIAIVQSTYDVTEMVLASDQIKLAELQLDEALSNGLIGSWIWDVQKNIVIGDKGLAKMFGVSSQEALRGIPMAMFTNSIFKDDRPMVEEAIAQALKKHDRFSAEYRTVDKAGEIHWVIARSKIERDDKGKPTTFPGIMIDITARKIAEEALKESEARLRFMADTVPQLVWTSDPEGNIDYYNRRWEEFTGVTLSTASSDERHHVLHPDDTAKVQKAWGRSLKNGTPYELEYRLYHAPSGSYLWVIGRAEPFRDASGILIKWYGTATEIDAQKRTALRQDYLGNVSTELSSSLNYKATMKKISELCVPEVADWCSVELHSEEKGIEQVSVAHVNPKKVSLAKEYRKHNPVTMDQPTGVPAVIRSGKPEFYPVITEEMIRASLDDEEKLEFMLSLNLCSIIIAPITAHNETIGAITFISSDSGRYYNEADFAMAQDVAARISLSFTNVKLFNDASQELKQRRQLEKELLLEKQKLESRVKERTEQLQLTNAGLRDEITKRHTIEKQLQRNSEDLARSNQELQDFAYVASHDLQEPLRKIQAFGDLLLSEHGDALGVEGADYLGRMHSAANRMSNLIGDLLTFSRVASKPLPKRDIDLNQVIKEVLSDLESRISETKAVIRVGMMPTVTAEPTHMRQLLQNLIGNAIKFHKSDQVPIVTIRSRAKNEGVEIKVSDNGVGFDEKYLDRIFSVFQRLHERSKYDGTGIGLAVCRKIVERYDGTITATSKKGDGSTFIVWLPVKERTK